VLIGPTEFATTCAVVKQMDPDQPVTAISSTEDVLGEYMSRDKTYVLVLGVFAGTAVVLAAIGVVIPRFNSRSLEEAS
jgi:hypothetical protein